MGGPIKQVRLTYRSDNLTWCANELAAVEVADSHYGAKPHVGSPWLQQPLPSPVYGNSLFGGWDIIREMKV